MNIIFYLFYNFSMRFFIIRLDQHPSQNITRFSFSQNVLSYFWCNYFHFTLRFRKCASFVHSPRLWILSKFFVLILGPKYFDNSRPNCFNTSRPKCADYFCEYNIES